MVHGWLAIQDQILTKDLEELLPCDTSLMKGGTMVPSIDGMV